MSKNTSFFRLKLFSSVVVTTIAVIGCDSGGGGGGEGATTAPPANYLVASIPDFYFGTRDVGTVVSQRIELANRSGDIYPIHSLELLGINAEEFSTNLIGEITLKPAEKISLDVSFVPLTNGQKTASLDVKYDIIKQVSEEANINEQNYYAAEDLEKEGRFNESKTAYKSYLQGQPATSNKLRAAIKVPVLKESEKQGNGQDFQLYLKAVNSRDENDYQSALANVDKLLAAKPDSVYADDALYMKGYIQLMDKADYRSARDTMAALRDSHPDTQYYDTALFSEAMANDELGEPESARELYATLKDRHTSEGAKMLSLDLPKDNYLSRLWFDRAKQGLVRTDSI